MKMAEISRLVLLSDTSGIQETNSSVEGFQGYFIGAEKSLLTVVSCATVTQQETLANLKSVGSPSVWRK